ncbi:MAG: hypothetical protein B7Y15_11510 [Bacteroidetes bacterium 24-39-8]|nr:MAG: hypothetical protein B7Y69_07680 [Sphingobacteriia bacterium 35-40-8]OYZ48728.1 MAG: hypothetical protein B7Y15_11510 [Bacteroidetes bacterium 24-39-8]OZA63875.1 MAG: hypothetical protein B7X72_09675 [Sphingobacteriia bacterium 39-39-8]HQR93554.1 hypothetical protein [Sediminibacterium sp.]HQS55915.1 hypothetical protein [Sediminibacterium sp.]
MAKLTLKDIFSQLKADLIGKDSYRGVTLSYSWLANQLGHFSLAFFPTIWVHTAYKHYGQFKHPGLWAAISVAGAWFLFECYNFLGPLIKKKQSSSKLVFVPDGKYVFEPNWWNVGYDTATDVLFFILGAFSAGKMLEPAAIPLWANILLAILLIGFPGRYWYLTKIYQQKAVYPFQFRLSQWDFYMEPSQVNLVNDFLKTAVKNKSHLLVFGAKDQGKSSLGVGIANELSIQQHCCVYTTANKLYSDFFDSNSSDWSWRNCNVLVIDDINPGDPITHELVAAMEFLNMLDQYQAPHETNRSAIKNTAVIWILGNQSHTRNYRASWEKMIQEQLGVTNLNSIVLDHKGKRNH